MKLEKNRGKIEEKGRNRGRKKREKEGEIVERQHKKTDIKGEEKKGERKREKKRETKREPKIKTKKYGSSFHTPRPTPYPNTGNSDISLSKRLTPTSVSATRWNPGLFLPPHAPQFRLVFYYFKLNFFTPSRPNPCSLGSRVRNMTTVAAAATARCWARERGSAPAKVQ
jgi:hypothetical protein